MSSVPSSSPRPIKRPRRSPSSHSALPTSSTTIPYLTLHDHVHPLLILLSPLRHTQARILSRNLTAAGAVVLSPHLPSTTSLSTLTVITDDRTFAISRLAESTHSIPSTSVRYVTPQWASAVLRARADRPFSPFEHPHPSSLSFPPDSCTPSDQSSAPSFKPSSSISTISSSPGWVRHPTTLSTPDRIAILKSIPHLSCMRSTLSSALYIGPNDPLACALDALAHRRMLERGKRDSQVADARARAYTRAAAMVRCVPFALRGDENETAHLQGLGPRVCNAVREFVQTGRIKEAEIMDEMDKKNNDMEGKKKDEDNDDECSDVNKQLREVRSLSTLYGVGVATAWSLAADGVTAADLRAADLPGADASWARVTWHEAWALRTAVERAANGEGTPGSSLGVRVVLCGGFRRGESNGHDVDLVYCQRRDHDDDNLSNLSNLSTGSMFSNLFVNRLQDHGLIERVLARRQGFSKRDMNGHDVVHAVALVHGKRVRLDLVGVRNVKEMAFATLAWSGSTGFQRDLRLVANRRGWTFCERGLFEGDGRGGVRVGGECASEMDVFAALGLSYRPAFERAG